jgi:hypothetical protein
MENNFFSSNAFKSQLLKLGQSPISRLNGLSSILNSWNQQRMSSFNKLEADLSMTDIVILKDVIETEIGRLKLKNSEVVSDQILFMLIGAIKLQVQNNSDKPWELVNQSIKNFTKPEKSKSQIYVLLSLATLMLVSGIITKNNFLHKPPEQPTVFGSQGADSASATRDSTVNNLVSMYNKMKEGNCQLPQAAMLQPKDREAFIAFINEGKVDIGTADNLKSALGYVNCLYPQKLMDQPL